MKDIKIDSDKIFTLGRTLNSSTHKQKIKNHFEKTNFIPSKYKEGSKLYNEQEELKSRLNSYTSLDLETSSVCICGNKDVSYTLYKFEALVDYGEEEYLEDKFFLIKDSGFFERPIHSLRELLQEEEIIDLLDYNVNKLKYRMIEDHITSVLPKDSPFYIILKELLEYDKNNLDTYSIYEKEDGYVFVLGDTKYTLEDFKEAYKYWGTKGKTVYDKDGEPIKYLNFIHGTFMDFYTKYVL